MINVPTGISDFRKIRTDKYFYIDKTYFLEELLKTHPAEISLITRPRRFGKTLTISMLSEFFDITKKSSELFNGLIIKKNKGICSAWMNQYPVLALSLKGIGEMSYQSSLNAIASLLGDLCREHHYLLDSKKLQTRTQKILQSFYDESASEIHIRNSLKVFTDALYQHFDKPVILLLDEYDVPLNEAWKNNFYDQMVNFMRGFLGEALKDNKYLKFALVTGCLRISKESIFTGVNNFKCYTISNNTYSDVFGFTDAEVDLLLNKAEFIDNKDDTRNKIKENIKKWYDGYRFGKNTEVYCPWDILQYISDLQEDQDKIPEPYWINTSSNSIVRSLVENDELNIKEALEVLLNGGSVQVALQEAMSFDTLNTDPELIWSLLYSSGYLTKSTIDQDTNKNSFIPSYSGRVMRKSINLVIPNQEIREIFIDAVDTWFSKTVAKNVTFQAELLDAIWQANSEKVTGELKKILLSTISYYDTQEYFYHAFLTGLLAGTRGLKVETNRENGHGRTDIIIIDQRTNRMAIFEIKHLKIRSNKTSTYRNNPLLEVLMTNKAEVDANLLAEHVFYSQEMDRDKRKKLLKYLAEKALLQIKEQQYAASYLLNNVYQSIVIFGIAFCKKECLATAEILDPSMAVCEF